MSAQRDAPARLKWSASKNVPVELRSETSHRLVSCILRKQVRSRSLSRQAHQTKKALLTWCLPYPGALEVECVKKTFQWNCAPKRATGSFPASRKGERIARRLRGQAHQKKKDTANAVSFSFGALEGTRTPDLLVRSQSLYPAELQAHPVWCCFQSAYL